MSTPAQGNDGGRRDAADDGAKRTDASGTQDSSDNPTEAIDTGRTGSGASSSGRSVDGDPGSAGTSRRDPQNDAGGYVPGAYSADDDGSGDYVPGMYSDGDAGTTSGAAGTNAAPTRRQDYTNDATPTRQQDRTSDATRQHDRSPIAASRDQEPRTQAHTQVTPVTATKNASEDQTGAREHRLPRGAGAGAGVAGYDAGSRQGTTSGLPTLEDRKLLHQREKEHFGGMKFGSAFFGWLTATGLFVLLSAVVSALAALFGFGGGLSTSDLTSGSAEAQTTGITAAVVLGVILLVSYYAGGYVAGRMARFSGVKQGIAVWLWAVIVAVVVAIIGFIIGNQAAATEQFQQLGVPSTQDLAGPGLIGLLIVAAIALVGAILGGLAGMRYHRRIDRTDFDALEETA